MLVGCSSDPDELVTPTPPWSATPEIRISGGIDGATRVLDGAFCDGDQVGLYGVNYEADNTVQGELLDAGNQVDNARYTYDKANNQWVSSGSIYYKNADTHIDLYAYYPYGTPTDVENYLFTVQQDQSGEGVVDGFSLSDFLWSKREDVTPTTETILLHFTHSLSCVEVVLVEGEGFAEGAFENLEKQLLVLNTVNTASINLSTGEAAPTGEASREGIVMRAAGEGFRAIVVPQQMAAATALFSITLDGIPYRFKMSEATEYAAGKLNRFSIEVSYKAHTGEYAFQLADAEIEDWVIDHDEHTGEARQYYVVHQEEPGTLSAQLRAAKKNPAKIKNLKISGKIDAADFFFMRDSKEILQAINLKEAEIGETTRASWYRNGRTTNASWAEDYTPEGSYPANEIPDRALYTRQTLVSFEFPEYVTRIGYAAFGQTLLSGALVIPNDVEEIANEAFAGTNISSLQLNHKLRILGSSVFEYCRMLSGSLYLPQSLEEMGNRCFYYCTMLSGSLELPQKLTAIPSECFLSCGFTGDLVIPERVHTIGPYAFQDVKFRGFLTLPKGLKMIDIYAFSGCYFQGELFIPKFVQKIPQGAFASNRFTSIVFEEGSELVSIESGMINELHGAFGDNPRLYEPLILPEGLLSIGAYAFGSARQLTSVVIPSTVTTIGECAFHSCSYISSFTCKATTPPICGRNALFGIPKDNFTLEVPEGAVAKYQTQSGWSDFKRIGAHYDFSISRPLMRTLNAEQSKTYLLRAPAHAAWSVESCPDWVTVTPSSGVGKTEVLITVSEMDASEVGTFEINTGSYESPVYETNTGRSGEIVFLLNEKDYRSTMTVEQYDYAYGDGDVIVNQTATVGGGVNLVFMGDCFDARDIAHGDYLDGINEAIGYYFAIEPYKSYRDYFNVYTVVGLSPDSGLGTVNTIKEAKFGSQYTLAEGITPDSETIFTYAMKAPTVNEENMNETLVVMVENTEDYGGICYMWGDGSAIAICPMSRDAYPYDFRGIVQHEAGGHGFAKLGDEYIYHVAFVQDEACGCSCCPHLSQFRAAKALGWCRNLSESSDYNTVEWAHLFMHPDYANIVDMYEGGYYHSRGIFRSEATSCMNNNIPYYSAIQRQEMVERIMRYAGEEFSLQNFYDNDVRDASNNDFVTSAMPRRRGEGTVLAPTEQFAPKFMGDKPTLR